MTNIREDIVNELHKPVRRNYVRRAVIVHRIDEIWQIDLVEMIPHADVNSGYKYLLTVIDCFSKQAFAKALKNKQGVTVSDAMNEIFVEAERHPEKIQSDAGSEFFCKPFARLMKLHKIHHYTTYSHMKVLKACNSFSDS